MQHAQSQHDPIPNHQVDVPPSRPQGTGAAFGYETNVVSRAVGQRKRGGDTTRRKVPRQGPHRHSARRTDDKGLALNAQHATDAWQRHTVTVARGMNVELTRLIGG